MNTGGSGISEAPLGVTRILSSTEEDTPMGHEGSKEVLDDIDETDLCFAGCVVSSLRRSTPIKQETQLEYESTYLGSLSERDGMLIESVRASSPSSFFQSDSICVTKDKSLIGHGDTWRDLPSFQEEAEYHTCTSEFDVTEKQGADFTFQKEITKGTSSHHEISGERADVKKSQFDEISAPGLADAEENSQSSEPNIESVNHPEKNNITRELLQKDNMARVDLCLRSVLSDPITGALLDDAMVAQCGHSFGSGSLQKVMDMHTCVTCGATTSSDLLVPNFALRAAVLAYKHEDQLQVNLIRGLKRRREVSELVEGSDCQRMERDHWGSLETISTDNSRSKTVKFPFVVSDKVLIKGNKRTPERFVGQEAVITTQCLNGWYLVKTLETGESVRLQYRSLRKLGDVEMPCTSEMDYLSEQGRDGSSSPVELSQDPNKAATSRELESGSPTSQCDMANGKLDEHGSEENNNMACLSERDLIQPPHSSEALIDGCLNNNLIGCVTPKSTMEELLNNQGRNTEHRFMEEEPNISVLSWDQQPNIERCVAAVGETVSDAMVEKFRTDLLNGTSTFYDESGDEQTAQEGPHSETSSKLSVGAKTDFLDTHTSNGDEVSPSKVLSTDPIEDVIHGGGPTGNKDQENENDIARSHSRCTSLLSKNSSTSGVCGQHSDPYRKVYSSGYRRQGGRGDTCVTMNPNDAILECKKNVIGQGCVRNYSEALHGGALGNKHGRDLKMKSTNEILQIMSKDMLKLEKQIPRYYLLNSWRTDRISWHKAVKASCTTMELGNLVRDFRCALLLTTAGGMTDEELERYLTTIHESGDVDLLVSLWGRLYDDVYKCVKSRLTSFSSLAHNLWRRLLTVEARDIKDLDLNSSGQLISPSQMMTATSTTDVLGDCQQNSALDIKTLLASIMTLLQKQSRMELMSVKEVLEREKRHIMAKLARLEYSAPPETILANSKLLGYCSSGHPCRQVSVPQNKEFYSCNILALSRPNDKMYEEEIRRTFSAENADGEATDLSDSD